MFVQVKEILKRVLPIKMYRLMSMFYSFRKDLPACAGFLCNGKLNISFSKKFKILRQLYLIDLNLEPLQTQEEILSYIQKILSLPSESEGVVVEAGCYKGNSTAKFSLAADIANRSLVVFDSFQGLPENDEPHVKNIFGGQASFKKGDYCGPLEEVKSNISKFGKIDCVRFVEGWFDDTMPKFKDRVACAYLDVDLASSTRTCLKYLYPLLEKGGILYSQDGHLPLVIKVFDDEKFWVTEVGFKKPTIEGLGKRKLIKITKESE